MKAKLILIVPALAALLALSLGLSAAQGPGTGLPTGPAGGGPHGDIGTAFTYQGQLKDAGGPVNGTCDFRFGLWDDPITGTSFGTVDVPGVYLVDGLFTARLDFGAAAHTGGARWLEVAVRCPSGSGTWVTLTPRQELTGAPAALALALPFTARGSTSSALFSLENGSNGPALSVAALGTGLYVANAGSDGIVVENAAEAGVAVHNAGMSGVYVNQAGVDGLEVGYAGEDGVYVYSAGSPSVKTPSSANNGFEVAGAESHGLYVGNAGQEGLYVANAGEHGIIVDQAQYSGLVVINAGEHGVKVEWAEGNGLRVYDAGVNGLYVYSAGERGVDVQNAGTDGLYVYKAGNPPAYKSSIAKNGVEIAGAEGYGLYVGRAGGDGVYVDSPNGTGVNVRAPGSHGLYVELAGTDGVNVAGNNWAGLFWGNIYVHGDCVGCVLAEFGVNAGNRPLQPGDIVAVQGVDASTLDNAPRLWQVVPAGGAGSVVGVVRGRAEVNLASEDQPLREGETGRRLVPRGGAAPPGDYLTIIIYGPAQVRVAASALGAIQAGTRLAVDADGLARPLRTVTVEGVTLAENAPQIGIALDSPDAAGLLWVLVNPR